MAVHLLFRVYDFDMRPDGSSECIKRVKELLSCELYRVIFL
jgi:hypothetical protein